MITDRQHAECAAETLLAMIKRDRSTMKAPIYGVFRGDVLLTWACARRPCHKFIGTKYDRDGLTVRYMGRV